MAYGHKTEHQARQRASIVLLAARGHSNARIATDTHLHVDTVRTWRGRFADGRLPALADRKRTGRPARFTPVQAAEAKALACQLPAETGTPLSRWSCPELAAELTARGITTMAPGQARAMRVNHEYGRGGALAYLAAYDVHHAEVFGRCEAKRPASCHLWLWSTRS